MEGCFSGYKKFNGRELKKLLIDGEPDYILRRGNQIFVFEFKDILLDATTKHSEDFNVIFNELKEQFVLSTIDKKSGKQKKKYRPKGIMQLLSVISTKLPILLNNLSSLYGFTIYPIIVYTDRNLEIAGINYFLNKEFESSKNLFEISEEYNVQPLVLLPLEDLTLLEDYFNSNKLVFESLIQGFYDEDKMLPFSKYMLREAEKQGYHHEMPIRFQCLLDELKTIN